MEIIEKIQVAFKEVDQERVVSIAKTCSEMVTPLKLDLAFLRNDQAKSEIIQSKQKEAQEKIKETTIKARYAVELYSQHLDIEYTKQANDQPYTVPFPSDDPSIFKIFLVRYPDTEDQYHEVDHLECALANAQKACAESVLWTIFYSELEDMEQEVNEGMNIDQKKELAENTIGETSVSKESNDGEISPYTRDCQRIFKDMKARRIFEYLQTNLASEKNQLADYTFIFRQMQRDEYIFEDIKEKTFRDFLFRHLEIEIDNKLKPEGYNVTELKERIYSNAIRSTQIESK